MKKLLIATGIVSALVMTGCASTTSAHDETQTAEHTHEHKHHKHHGKPPMKHKHGDSFTAIYQCNNNAKLTALYNPDDENSVLTITAPTLKLNGTQVTAQLAPSGSGMRFVNDTDTNIKYDWHTKGAFGVLDITTKGKTHTFKCEGDLPMHDHHH